MEARFLQQLQLMDVAEAPQVVDVCRVVAGGHAAAHLLVVVQQPEPDLVEVPPRDFVGGRPVEVVRAVVDAARRVEVHQRRQRVLRVPVGVAHAHHVAAGRVRGHRRIEDRAELDVLREVRLPLGAAGLVDLVPEPRHLAEAELLVVVVHLRGPRLDLVVLEQRFEVSVEMRDRAEPELRGGERVHLRDAALLEMRDGSQAELLPLVEQRRHDRRRVGDELHAVDAVRRAPAHPRACFLRRVDRTVGPGRGRDAGS